jgi:ketosteroid isomerase-like protein
VPRPGAAIGVAGTRDSHGASEVCVIDAPAVVLAFNEAINRRDVDALARLMNEGHRFVDPSGAAVHGRDACLEAWRGFFDTFPDYRNVFDEIADLGGGLVVVRGRSECSVAALEGPAAWRVVVIDSLVDVWQVSERGPDPH